jgi:hypothetical protein
MSRVGKEGDRRNKEEGRKIADDKEGNKFIIGR